MQKNQNDFHSFQVAACRTRFFLVNTKDENLEQFYFHYSAYNFIFPWLFFVLFARFFFFFFNNLFRFRVNNTRHYSSKLCCIFQKLSLCLTLLLRTRMRHIFTVAFVCIVGEWKRERVSGKYEKQRLILLSPLNYDIHDLE